MDIRTHRIYDDTPDELLAYRRVLIDRLWPRGITKSRADLDYWAKDISPSHDLRKWYRHDHEKWDEFRRRYYDELDGNSAGVNHLLEEVGDGPLLLLYSSKERELNNATALKSYLHEILS